MKHQLARLLASLSASALALAVASSAGAQELSSQAGGSAWAAVGAPPRALASAAAQAPEEAPSEAQEAGLPAGEGAGEEASGEEASAGGAGEEALEGEAPAAEEAAEEGEEGAPSPPRGGARRSQRIKLSSLQLSPGTRTRLHSGRLRIGQIALSFRASQGEQVTVQIRRSSARSRTTLWRPLEPSLRLRAHRGLNRVRLRGSLQLPPGAYRIELAASDGVRRTLLLRLR
ncbi:MAG TPA: hypothetical protein VKU89_05930 [Solirubrobacteraceae bacterium]|nr:hypothetical protein [Solirubrobacteraceae bacterium]